MQLEFHAAYYFIHMFFQIWVRSISQSLFCHHFYYCLCDSLRKENHSVRHIQIVRAIGFSFPDLRVSCTFGQFLYPFRIQSSLVQLCQFPVCPLIIRRIPTYTDFKELINGCNWWVPDWKKFVVGTSKTNGNVIIFPLTNHKSDATMSTNKWDLHEGCYWTSSLCLNDPSKVLYLCFDCNKPRILSKNRYEGLCLRYIIEKTPHNIK